MAFRIELLDQPCGVLSIEQERFKFAYLDGYLSIQGPPLSVSMPLREEPYPDRIAFPFFENLLPEGRIRRLIAEQLKTSESNFPRLFESLGEDVAGALRILPEAEGQAGERQQPLPLRKLNKRQLGAILKRIEVSPFLVAQKEGMRLSLAGAQNKLPVIVKDDAVYLAVGQPSTHIIKPPSVRFRGLVENEFLCMRGARRASLDVPEVELKPFRNDHGEEYDCLVITRYDRNSEGNETLRIHQEDLCQITSIPSSQKYTRDGGPGYAELFAAIRHYSIPSAIHQNELLRRVLYNLLIGNNDAHGKNFSILHTGKGIRLAPAYDLVATELYPELDKSFAMPFGQARSKKDLCKADLTAFATQTGISIPRQKKSLRDFVENAYAGLIQEIDELASHSYPDTVKTLKPLQRLLSANRRILLSLLQ